MPAVLWTFLAMLTAAYCESNQHLPEPVCGQVSLMLDNCFHNTTPKVAVDLLYTVKIPESAEEINARCMVFNRGMDCVQHYLNTCIDSKERKIIENEVYGARKLYGYLCRDKSFQREFLKHKACFHYMHNDWDSCSRNFISILKEEMARTTQQSFNVHARYGYESCVFNSASYKCKLESAVFLKKIAKLLSTDRHFLNCDRLENELCSAGPQGPVARMPLLLVATVPLLWLLLPLLMGTSGCYGRLV